MSEAKSTVIVPTIGRVMLCRPNGDHRLTHMICCEEEPFAAMVGFVSKENGTVNLAVVDHIGQMVAVQGVIVVQEGEQPPNEGVAYCHWMTYQLGQAAKTEEAEAKVATAEGSGKKKT